MDLNELIRKNNIDMVGKYFLKTGFEFFILNEIGKAYEYLKLGLNTLTCDCLIGQWKPVTINLTSVLPTYNNINPSEYLFCKAVILSYSKEIKYLYVALDTIDTYLLEQNDDLGFYVKGKILTELKEYNQAKESFEISYDLKPCSRTLYRLARLNEEFLDVFSIDKLYDAYISNPYSACCCRVLKHHTNKRKIKIRFMIDGIDNVLVEYFHDNYDQWAFQKHFENLLSVDEIADFIAPVKSKNIIDEFIDQLSQINDIFQSPDDKYYPEFYEPDYDYDEEYSQEDYDEMYFDAMTDGQMGGYWDFKESGRDLDSIDDWAGN